MADLTDLQADFLDWWVTPDSEKYPRYQTEWADDNGTTTETLRRWRKTEWWDAALRQRLSELNVSPDRVQAVIDALFATATDRDSKSQVQAARVLLEYTQQLMPVKPVAPADRPIEMLTDQEIEELLREEALKQRDSRSTSVDVQPEKEEHEQSKQGQPLERAERG